MNVRNFLFMNLTGKVLPFANLEDIMLAQTLGEKVRTIIGNPLTFRTKKAQKALNPSLTLLPVQDLHGYDKPWVGGVGKNKSSINSVSLVRGTTDSVEEACAPIPAGDYIITNTPSGTATVVRVTFLDANMASVGTSATITTSPLNITTNGEATYLRVYIGGSNPNGMTFSTNDLMIRSASETDATFAPYKNICPISGRDSAEIIRTNVNLWDEITEMGIIDQTTGQDSPTTNQIRSKNYTPIQPNTEYTFLCEHARISQIFWYDKNKDFLSFTYNTAASVFITTSPANAYYVRFQFPIAYGTIYQNDASLNIPSSYTTYVASNRQTIDFTFDNTVYGAVIDLDTGVMTVGWDIVDMGTLTYAQQSMGIVQVFKNTIQTVTGYNPKRAAGTNVISDAWSVFDTTNSVRINTNILAENFAAAASGHYLCYPLETPQTIQLTPQEINLLKGVNNIWTDGDSIELTYKG